MSGVKSSNSIWSWIFIKPRPTYLFKREQDEYLRKGKENELTISLKTNITTNTGRVQGKLKKVSDLSVGHI